MYSRIIRPPQKKSFFLFGPRGTGKTTWLKTNFKDAIYLDLLESELFNDFLAQPERLEQFIPKGFKGWVILDEVQRVPALLYEVHRLIESQGFKFILTGSSARKLRQKEVNLLAGRALTDHLYPLTAAELKNDFSLSHSLKFGHLPSTFKEADPKRYLESYVATYLKEEVQQEGLTRNLAAFSRFLESASFSQGQVMNLSEVARECSVHRKVVESYFTILEDLLIAERLPIFTRRAKRRLAAHPKFYFFDVGVYRTLRPQGPLDSTEEIEGVSLETLVYQELRAINDYLNLGYQLFYWRTVTGQEVDFVLYGPRGLIGIEVKRNAKIGGKQLSGVKMFLKEYPNAKAFVLFGGKRKKHEGNIEMVPVEEFLRSLKEYI